ncbi:MAG TPA: hypothetical protein PLW34_03535 [Termitinemataceae bacterium]|nr:hypothetical protein [Termitinemataceae bacterium]HOM23850.1 hypothetical protein [Termitinemataceae bacterium]HPP99886.1 hypothetical protein [Termitinemataceae bacterium]
MIVYVATEKDNSCLSIKTAKGVELRSGPAPNHQTVDLSGVDILYFDIESYPLPAIRKVLSLLQRREITIPWGVLCKTQHAEDPALFFQEGACDYLGPSLVVEEGLSVRRLKRALSLAAYLSRGKCSEIEEEEMPATSGNEGEQKKSSPPYRFPGWQKIQVGRTYPFYLVYVTLDQQDHIKESLGDSRFQELRSALHRLLTPLVSPVDGLLWMQRNCSFLFLVPYEERRISRVIEQLLRFFLNFPLITCEELHLDRPVGLIAAIHGGELPFAPPGQTGSVISEAVNFIHHLGMKRAEVGRLTLSAPVASAIPATLGSLFVSAGTFEGYALTQSVRFFPEGNK